MKTIASPVVPSLLHELLWFSHRQFLACLFGLLLLAGLLLTKSWDAAAPLSRQDFLFLYALGLQIVNAALIPVRGSGSFRYASGLV